MNKEEKKLYLMNVALDQFYKNGMDKTTIVSITQEANMGKSTFYEYFASKEEVIYCWLESLLEKMEELESHLENFSTNKEKIMFIIAYSCSKEYMDDKLISFYAEFWRLALSQKEAKAISLLHNLYKEFSKFLIEFIKIGIKNGEFKECDEEKIASAILAVVDGHWIQYMVSENYDLQEYTEYSVSTILKGIENV